MVLRVLHRGMASWRSAAAGDGANMTDTAAVLDLVDRELARVADEHCELCLAGIRQRARDAAPGHYALLLRDGFEAADAARYAAVCAVKVSAEVQEMVAHRAVEPSRAELDAVIQRAFAETSAEMFGRPS